MPWDWRNCFIQKSLAGIGFFGGLLLGGVGGSFVGLLLAARVLLDPFPTAFLPNLIATFYGNFLLIGLMAGWDLWRRGTLDRAFAIGASLLVASEVGAVALQYSPAWKQIAIAITRAWGYAG